ncbi:MAG TPA: DJ-1/PfpI family protein [Alphaproteobacteria bacterium]|nr:DJ-1/PfpI family protein [Alphaproteobacteria bacterium]
MSTMVGILIFDGVEELDAVGPYEVFGVARGLRPDLFDVCLVAERAEPVECVNRMRILPHHGFADAPRLDVLVIPGGIGTRREAGNEALLHWVRETAARCAWVASVCSGARVTLASGLAAGRRITTHSGVVQELRDRGGAAAVLDDVRFVRDGNLVHSAGISAGIDMSLWLVGQIAGDPAVARAVRREMEYDPAPPYAYEA